MTHSIPGLPNGKYTGNSLAENVSCFLPLQCPVSYDIVGDGLSPYLFAVNASTGWITVKENLADDTGLVYKVNHGSPGIDNTPDTL